MSSGACESNTGREYSIQPPGYQTMEQKALAANVKTCGTVTTPARESSAADSPKQKPAWTTFIEHKGWVVSYR